MQEGYISPMSVYIGSIGLQMNVHKKYVCFNQKRDNSTLNSGSLKPVDKFTHLRNSVSSTENDINSKGMNCYLCIIDNMEVRPMW